jgi:hypothetical protein
LKVAVDIFELWKTFLVYFVRCTLG